jgi:hypothetical protein
VDPVRLTTDFPYVFGLHHLQFRVAVVFQKYDPPRLTRDCYGSPKEKGIYLNSLRDNQMDVVCTLIGSGTKCVITKRKVNMRE